MNTGFFCFVLMTVLSLFCKWCKHVIIYEGLFLIKSCEFTYDVKSYDLTVV